MDVGGQAVIEGVMMRNKEKYAVAVRLKEENIKIHQEKNTKYPKYFQFFFWYFHFISPFYVFLLVRDSLQIFEYLHHPMYFETI